MKIHILVFQPETKKLCQISFIKEKTELNYCFIMKVCAVAWISFLTNLRIAWPVLKKKNSEFFLLHIPGFHRKKCLSVYFHLVQLKRHAHLGIFIFTLKEKELPFDTEER